MKGAKTKPPARSGLVLLRALDEGAKSKEPLTASDMGNSPDVIFGHYRALVDQEASEEHLAVSFPGSRKFFGNSYPHPPESAHFHSVPRDF